MRKWSYFHPVQHLIVLPPYDQNIFVTLMPQIGVEVVPSVALTSFHKAPATDDTKQTSNYVWHLFPIHCLTIVSYTLDNQASKIKSCNHWATSKISCHLFSALLADWNEISVYKRQELSSALCAIQMHTPVSDSDEVDNSSDHQLTAQVINKIPRTYFCSNM